MLATRPNEVWSWDITKLKGSVKWAYFDLPINSGAVSIRVNTLSVMLVLVPIAQAAGRGRE